MMRSYILPLLATAALTQSSGILLSTLEVQLYGILIDRSCPIRLPTL
jgi:hypothetical protein